METSHIRSFWVAHRMVFLIDLSQVKVVKFMPKSHERIVTQTPIGGRRQCWEGVDHLLHSRNFCNFHVAVVHDRSCHLRTIQILSLWRKFWLKILWKVVGVGVKDMLWWWKIYPWISVRSYKIEPCPLASYFLWSLSVFKARDFIKFLKYSLRQFPVSRHVQKIYGVLENT